MENIEIKKILRDFANKKVLIIGDVMLDHYLYGEVNRINPEAPVPIVERTSEKYILGGAANVAANVSSLMGNATLLGFIGKDFEGEKIIELARELKIAFIPSYGKKTSKKTRISSGVQNLIRIDDEEKSEKFFDEKLLKEKIGESDIIIVSDYAKGAITKELMKILLDSQKKIIIDPKPKNKEIYKGCYLITPNKNEAFEISGMQDIQKAGNWIQKNISEKAIITRSSEGMTTFDKEMISIPTYAKEVYDVSGAGDTVIATIALSVTSGATLEQSAIIANHAAGIVLGKLGTARVTLKELMRKFSQEDGKIKTIEELEEIVSDHHSKGNSIAWTNGCFDLLHQGHVNYLKKAKATADILIVGLNSDESIKGLKGPSRPIQSQEARSEILAALEFVDYILIFQEQSPSKYISKLKPEFFIKAGDYTLDTLNNEEVSAIKSHNGKIIFIPLIKGASTTNIIDKIKNGK